MRPRVTGPDERSCLTPLRRFSEAHQANQEEPTVRVGIGLPRWVGWLFGGGVLGTLVYQALKVLVGR